MSFLEVKKSQQLVFKNIRIELLLILALVSVEGHLEVVLVIYLCNCDVVYFLNILQLLYRCFAMRFMITDFVAPAVYVIVVAAAEHFQDLQEYLEVMK